MVVLQQIVLAALRAASPAGCIKLQAMAHSAHPANLNTWISNNQGVWFNTLCHNRARTNECILTNVMTTDNSGICANSCSPANPGVCVFMLSVDATSWIDNISKDTGGA